MTLSPYEVQERQDSMLREAEHHRRVSFALQREAEHSPQGTRNSFRNLWRWVTRTKTPHTPESSAALIRR